MRGRLSLLFFAAALVIGLPACSAESDRGATAGTARYVAGEHYRQLPEPVATGVTDQVTVYEFFLYGCPHCYSLEPEVEAWIQQLPEHVRFRRMPVTFSRAGPIYARMFFTAKALDVLDELHKPIFDAIHEDGRDLVSRGAIRAFFVANADVDPDAFDRAFDSEAVQAEVERADRLMRAFGVRSVPSFGVAGRYWVPVKMAGGNEAMFQVTEFLIDETRRRRR